MRSTKISLFVFIIAFSNLIFSQSYWSWDNMAHLDTTGKYEYRVNKVKLMDYAHTDFENEHFDLIYAQGSISVPGKKEITRELKRILKSQGFFCAGEIVSLKEPIPGFVADIWERSGLDPIPSSEIKKYYEVKGFEVLNEKDISDTLKDFYEKIRTTVAKVRKDEKEADKKYFSRMRHESHAYLKLGGDKYIGFKSLIMRKLN